MRFNLEDYSFQGFFRCLIWQPLWNAKKQVLIFILVVKLKLLLCVQKRVHVVQPLWNIAFEMHFLMCYRWTSKLIYCCRVSDSACLLLPLVWWWWQLLVDHTRLIIFLDQAPIFPNNFIFSLHIAIITTGVQWKAWKMVASGIFRWSLCTFLELNRSQSCVEPFVLQHWRDSGSKQPSVRLWTILFSSWKWRMHEDWKYCVCLLL